MRGLLAAAKLNHTYVPEFLDFFTNEALSICGSWKKANE